MKRPRIPTYHGPFLAAWLKEEGHLDRMTVYQQRSAARWAGGVYAAETAVDALMCDLGLHLNDIPVWVALGCEPSEVDGLEFRYSLKGERWLESEDAA